MSTVVFENIRECLTLQGAAQKQARRVEERDLSILQNAVLIVENGKVKWVGPKKDLAQQNFKLKSAKKINLKGSSVMPGFIECHTHLPFAGDRSKEFEMRQQGVSYQEISANGGGIVSTVRATRAISKKELTQICQLRADKFSEQGVTTLEVKSGYGLNAVSETQILTAAKNLKGPQIVKTFLGLHAFSPEVKAGQLSASDYVTLMVDQVLPDLKKKKLVDRVDVYVEKGFFTRDDAKRLFRKAKSLNLGVSAHVEQLSRQGGFQDVIEAQGLSADHLVQVKDDDIKALAASEVTAVLLPASDFYLSIEYPPARKMIDAGARVALSTDFNPGTSPTQDLSFIGVLARIQMKMSLAETLVAWTLGASYALGFGSHKGFLSVGADADFCVFDGSWNRLFYQVGHHPVRQTYRAGRLTFQKK